MDTARYLERIRYSGPVTRDVETLEALQRAHLTAVPFENLHVFARRGVATSTDWSVEKIVGGGRGGWCFELNGAFSALLSALGFGVTRLAATVLLDDVVSAEPSHLVLEVGLDRPYLVDVGFGDSFIRPIPLDDPGPHDAGTGRYVVAAENGVTTLSERTPEGDAPQYRFARTGVEMASFDAASHRLQTEPGLQWTAAPFATRLLEGGPDRVTLLHDRIKFRHDGVWTERPVAAEHWDAVLLEWFGMTP